MKPTKKLKETTIEDKLEFLDEVKNGWDWQPDENKMFDAIRALIIAVGEWQERADTIGDGLAALILIQDIRDFGKEGK